MKRLLIAGFFCLTGAFAAAPVRAEQPTAPAQASSVWEVLSPQDVEKYAEAFSLLDEGEIKAAQDALQGVQNALLKGLFTGRVILAQPSRKPTQKEIEGWLKKYRDQPIASEVYEFAMRKDVHVTMSRPKDAAAHFTAGSCTSMRIPDPMDYSFYKKVNYVPAQDRASVRRSMQFFSSALRRGKTLAARLHFQDKKVQKHLSRKDREESLTSLGFAYFVDQEDDKALEVLKPVLDRGDQALLLARWTAGLVYWRKKDYPNAQIQFQTIADSPKASPVFKAAADFWTTRAMIKNGMFYAVTPYLKDAATVAPHSVYGILAQRSLGWDISQNWKDFSVTPSDADDVRVVAQTNGGKRALAFLQLDMIDEAERELIKLYAENPAMRKTLASFASSLSQAPELSARLAGLRGEIETPTGQKALYPFPNWTPLNDWKIDKALIYAFVRQESCFKNKAFSNAGARGVMQLMPSTAKVSATLNKEVKKGLEKEVKSAAAGQVQKQLGLSDAAYKALVKGKIAFNSKTAATIYNELRTNKNGVFYQAARQIDAYAIYFFAAIGIAGLLILLIVPFAVKKIAKKLASTYTQCPYCHKVYLTKGNAFNILKMVKFW